MKTIFIILFLFGTHVFAQPKDPNQIIQKTKDVYSQIIDYQVDAKVYVDVEFIKIPIKKIKIFFKQPDKIKFESKGFVMVHKKGTNFFINNFLKSQYTAIYVKSEQKDKYFCDIIKVIPSDEASDIILTTFWIDNEKSLIRKIESTTRTNGSYTIELFYANHPFNLPDKMVLNFVAGQKPQMMPIGDDNDTKEKNKTNQKKAKKGNVMITYSNYQVNKGIDDSFFKDDNKKK